MNITMRHLHLFLFGAFVYGIHYNVMRMKPPVTPETDFNYKMYGGRLKFLSFQNLCIQCIFFGVCVLNDYLGSESQVHSRRSTFQRLHDWLFSCIVMPLGLNVSLAFWISYFYDRELILPRANESFSPLWLAHIMHTLPAVGVMSELCTIYHVFPQGFKLYCPAIVLMLLYTLWVLFVYYISGMWVYKVFQLLSVTGLLIYLTCQMLVLLLCAYIGSKIHQKVWGEKLAKEE